MLLDAPLFIAGPDGAVAAPVLAEAGLDGAFAFEGPEDVFIPLARAAGAADLDLYSNVAIAFPRSPTHVAHTAWDLQRLSGGRFMLGLGSQVKAHVERRFGAAFDHPVDRMADFVGAVQDVMASWRDGTKLEHRGPYWSLDLMPPMFRPSPLDGEPPPVHVAALGPRMTAMATASADGVILHPFTTDSYLRDHSLAAIDAGLAAAARDRDRFTVIAGAIMAVGSDADERKAAREGARANIAFYGSTPAYRGVLESVGRGDLQPELRELTRNQGWDQLRGLVDDDLVEQVAICGDPDEVADKLVARGHGAVDRVAMSFAYGVRMETVAALATAVRDRTQ